jgi:hypothetical protein
LKHPKKIEFSFSEVLGMQAELVGKLRSQVNELEGKLEFSVERMNHLLGCETAYRGLIREKAVRVAHLVKDLHGTLVMKVLGEHAMHYSIAPAINDVLKRICDRMDAIVILRVDDFSQVKGLIGDVKQLPVMAAAAGDDAVEARVMEAEVMTQLLPSGEEPEECPQTKKSKS